MEELKEMVIKNLDSQGVLDSIRAQLRANVFQAILSQEGKPGVSLPANDASRIMETERGQACAELLREFMGKSGLRQTLGVFAAETKLPVEQMDRRVLESKLRLKARPDQPLLLSMLDRLKEKQRLAEDAAKSSGAQIGSQAGKGKEVVQPLAKPIPERSFGEGQRTGFEPGRPADDPKISSLKPDLKPLSRAPALAPLDRKLDTDDKKFDFDSKKPGGALNLERKFAAAGLGRAAVFEDDESGEALPEFNPKPAPAQTGKKEEMKAGTGVKKEEPKLAPIGKKEEPPKQTGKKEDSKPFFTSKTGPKVFDLHSSGEEEVEEDIEAPEEAELEVEVQPAKAPLLESMGTSSLGVDASVDSLALEEYDHVEKVAKVLK